MKTEQLERRHPERRTMLAAGNRYVPQKHGVHLDPIAAHSRLGNGFSHRYAVERLEESSEGKIHRFG
jgi:hypothetical protein